MTETFLYRMSAEPIPRPKGMAVDDVRVLTLFEPWLEARREAARAIWRDPRSWAGWWYYGYGDPRLWVPARSWGGRPSARWRVPNFGHPRARLLCHTVVVGHVVLAVGVILGVAVALGRTW